MGGASLHDKIKKRPGVLCGAPGNFFVGELWFEIRFETMITRPALCRDKGSVRLLE